MIEIKRFPQTDTIEVPTDTLWRFCLDHNLHSSSLLSILAYLWAVNLKAGNQGKNLLVLSDGHFVK